MAVAIRLARGGSKKRPYYRIVVADSRHSAQHESGDVILSGASVHAEIGELLAGSKPMPPAGATLIFKSLGQAVEDAVAARLVYDAHLASK